MFADTALAARMEAADARGGLDFVRVKERVDPSSGAAAEEIGGGVMFFSGASSPVNGVIGLGFAGPVADAEFERVEAFFAARGVEPCIHSCPLADPSLVRVARARGYALLDYKNMWFRPLGGDLPEPEGQGADVIEVGPAEADEWALTLARGFAGRDDVTEDELSFAGLGFHMEGARGFLGRVGGRPAGAATMALRGGVAVLYGTSTAVGFRGRGVQTALIRRRLAEAASAGCDLAIVMTVPGSASQRNVQRAGFQLAYTKARLTRALP